MAKTLIVDEIHLTIRIPRDAPNRQAEAIRATLTSDAFMERLRRAVRAVIRVYPDLSVVRVSLTR